MVMGRNKNNINSSKWIFSSFLGQLGFKDTKFRIETAELIVSGMQRRCVCVHVCVCVCVYVPVCMCVCAFKYRPWLPRWLSDKDSACQYKRCRLDPWVRKIPWSGKRQSTPGFWPRESHGQSSLVVYSSWGHIRVGYDWITKQQQHGLLTEALLSLALVQIPAPLLLTVRQVLWCASLFGAWFYHL